MVMRAYIPGPAAPPSKLFPLISGGGSISGGELDMSLQSPRQLTYGKPYRIVYVGWEAEISIVSNPGYARIELMGEGEGLILQEYTGPWTPAPETGICYVKSEGWLAEPVVFDGNTPIGELGYWFTTDATGDVGAIHVLILAEFIEGAS